MSKCPFRNQTHIAAVCLSRSYDPQVSGRVSSLPLSLLLSLYSDLQLPGLGDSGFGSGGGRDGSDSGEMRR